MVKMEKIEKDFDNISKYMNRLSSLFSSEISSKQNVLDSLIKDIHKKEEMSNNITSKLQSVESNIAVLQKKLHSVEDEIVAKKKEKSNINDKKGEILELERKREEIILDTDKIIRNRNDVRVSLTNCSKDLKEIQNYLDKLSNEKVALLGDIKSNNEIIEAKKDNINYLDKKISPLNNEISKKESKIGVLDESYIQREKEFDSMKLDIKHLQNEKINLDIKIGDAEIELKRDLDKLRDMKDEFDLEKSKLKHEEDRLLTIKKEIQQTILDNRNQLDSKKIADFIKSVEDANKNA